MAQSSSVATPKTPTSASSSRTNTSTAAERSATARPTSANRSTAARARERDAVGETPAGASTPAVAQPARDAARTPSDRKAQRHAQLVVPETAASEALVSVDVELVRARLADLPELSPRVRDRALAAYEKLAAEGKVRQPVLTILDFGKPSTEKRLWAVDMRTGNVVLHELVAHGSGSVRVPRAGERPLPPSRIGADGKTARHFSNRDGSHATSLGTFLTGGTYRGKHGTSVYLNGLDVGINDNARSRAVVIHSAPYVDDAIIQRTGRLGLSQGCPVVRPRAIERLAKLVAGGSVVFADGGDESLLAASRFLR